MHHTVIIVKAHDMFHTLIIHIKSFERILLFNICVIILSAAVFSGEYYNNKPHGICQHLFAIFLLFFYFSAFLYFFPLILTFSDFYSHFFLFFTTTSFCLFLQLISALFFTFIFNPIKILYFHLYFGVIFLFFRRIPYTVLFFLFLHFSFLLQLIICFFKPVICYTKLIIFNTVYILLWNFFRKI